MGSAMDAIEEGPPKQTLERDQQETESERHLLDDSVGRDDETHNLFTRLLAALRRQRAFLFGSVSIVVAWSCLCAWFAEYLHDEAANDPGGHAENWLAWLEGAGSKFRMVGILFVFAVVFRFNRCYDRWNQGRIIWGRLISLSLDITRMASYWIVDDNYADHFCRFVVVLAYSCKALLRGNTLSDETEEGKSLIQRGFLTPEELDDMEDNLGWQTHYCLDMLSTIWTEAHFSEKALVFDQGHKVHSQLFRAIDGNISQLNSAVGDAIRLRASGLPETYDGLHHVIFYFYFILSPVFFAPTIGWVLPMVIGLESLLILAFVVMGSDLIQPFGVDRVDLPLEFFCENIESQTQHIRERSKRKTLLKLARVSSRPTQGVIPKSTSLGRTIKGDHKKVDNEAVRNSIPKDANKNATKTSLPSSITKGKQKKTDQASSEMTL